MVGSYFLCDTAFIAAGMRSGRRFWRAELLSGIASAKLPVATQPALRATRHFASASHQACPPKRIRAGLTFGYPPFSFDRMHAQLQRGLPA